MSGGNYLGVSAVLALSVLASASSACEGSPITGEDINKPVQLMSDGSFQFAGPTSKNISFLEPWKWDPHDTVSGAAILDLQNGMTAQVVSTEKTCSHTEVLVVTDCNSLQSLTIDGVFPPPPEEGTAQIAGFSGEYVAAAVGPHGRMRIYQDDTLATIQERAKSVNLGVSENALTLQDGWKKQDQYNIFFGCTLYYPDSAGANQ